MENIFLILSDVFYGKADELVPFKHTFDFLESLD